MGDLILRKIEPTGKFTGKGEVGAKRDVPFKITAS